MNRQTPPPFTVGFLRAQDPDSGGLFQYSETIYQDLNTLANEGKIAAPKFFHRAGLATSPDQAADLSVAIEPPSLKRTLRSAVRRTIPVSLRDSLRRWAGDAPVLEDAQVDQQMATWIRGHGVSALMLPSPDRLAFEAGVPSIMAIHDLQHRLQPDFPEVAEGGQLALREYVYRNAAREALLLLVDSEIGKEDVLDLYGEFGATEDKIEILPFIPPPGLRIDIPDDEAAAITRALSLPEPFLFYPAQFWPHKNHVRVVEAIASLSNREIHIVFCGSNAGSIRRTNFDEVMKRVQELGIHACVHYLGYVSDDVLSALYSRASALLFPTFFGPTNIPVIEAWNFGLPVITSRIRGIVEQVGDAAVLVDPSSVEEIAAGVERVLSSSEERARLAKAGRARLDLYTPEDHRQRLLEILINASERLSGDD